jgi:ribosomal protein S18 acetylase RimI-like enzyme
MTLKKCGIRDLDLLVTLGRETYYDSFAAMNSKETMTLYLESAFHPNKLKQEIENKDSHFYIAYEGKIPAAYLKLNLAPSQTDINDADSIEIERIYVKKEFMGQGIGKALIQFSQEIGQKMGCSYAWLGVWEQNDQGIEFYKKNGFHPKGDSFLPNGRRTPIRSDISKEMGSSTRVNHTSLTDLRVPIRNNPEIMAPKTARGQNSLSPISFTFMKSTARPVMGAITIVAMLFD